MSLTEAVASVNKFAANVYVQLSLAKRNDTIGSVGGTRVGVCLRYAVEQQAVASAVLFQGVHLVGERLVIAVEGSQLSLHGCCPSHWPRRHFVSHSPVRRSIRVYPPV